MYNERKPKNPSHLRYNLKLKQRKAITSLKNNKDILIKPADKGRAIVIMNKKDYLQEGFRQLANEKHYKKLDRDPTISSRKIQGTHYHLPMTKTLSPTKISKTCTNISQDGQTYTYCPRFIRPIILVGPLSTQ